MARWSIKNYNAWIREARKVNPDVTLQAARRAYKVASERLGRNLFGRDVARHPRISKDSLKTGIRQESRARSNRARRDFSSEANKPAKRSGSRPRGAKTDRRGGDRITSISQYLDFLEDYGGEFEDVEYESSADY